GDQFTGKPLQRRELLGGSVGGDTMWQTKPPRKVPGGIPGLSPDLDRPHGLGRGDPSLDARIRSFARVAAIIGSIGTIIDFALPESRSQRNTSSQIVIGSATPPP